MELSDYVYLPEQAPGVTAVDETMSMEQKTTWWLENNYLVTARLGTNRKGRFATFRQASQIASPEWRK